VVVVVGAVVVVVVDVLVGVVATDPLSLEDGLVDVVEVDVGVGVVVEVVPSFVAGGTLEPGCSLATTTPMTAVAPVADSTTARVSRRSRRRARSRSCGVCPTTEPEPDI
jgi:hypothetical protein